MTASIAPAGAVVRALDAARSIRLGAYVLSDGAVRRALERAGDRGADVAVTLAGEPFAGAAAATFGARAAQAARRELEAHHVRVRVAGAGEPTLHFKGAAIDGEAYLDDRNWTDDGADTVLRTSDAKALATVAAALDGVASPAGALATDKPAALRDEAAAIANGSGDRIDVESETFGRSAVSKALYDRLAGGAHVRLLVTAREADAASGTAERAALDRLAGRGSRRARLRQCGEALRCGRSRLGGLG